MTSKIQTCYVYINLPGKTQAVTAGRFQLYEGKIGIPVGEFIYSRHYLNRDDAVALDPVDLTLKPNIFQTTALKGIFGVLRDAGPDYWGRRIIERHSGHNTLTELDYLLHSPEDRAGALSFGLNKIPPAPKRKFNKTLALEKLIRTADQLVRDETIENNSALKQIQDIMLVGTSMGGARPKAVVEDKEGLWLAKFNRFDDSWNQARVEHAMLLLAKACGCHTANSKLVKVGDQDVLLVKRFDREKTSSGYLKSRMISALTLLKAEDTHRSRDKWSYLALAEELRRISHNAEQDTLELFKRMSFNALISNTDDHPRNHALTAKSTHWGLSPAYDLTPTTPISQEHRDLAMICGNQGRFANAKNLLSQHGRFLLTESDAKAILDAMQDTVKSQWYAIAKNAGVTEKDCEKIQSAFVYPGFNYV